MKQKLTFEDMKGRNENSSHPLAQSDKRYLENVLTPIKLSGVVEPWYKSLTGGRTSEFKLVCSSGLEYFFIADPDWRDILSQYCWNEVKVVGLLNVSNMTLIPQKVFPKGPRGQIENVIDLETWKGQKHFKKIIDTITDQVVIPVAVLTWIKAKTN
jgi:hypothetical protein